MPVVPKEDKFRLVHTRANGDILSPALTKQLNEQSREAPPPTWTYRIFSALTAIFYAGFNQAADFEQAAVYSNLAATGSIKLTDVSACEPYANTSKNAASSSPLDDSSSPHPYDGSFIGLYLGKVPILASFFRIMLNLCTVAVQWPITTFFYGSKARDRNAV